MKITLKSGKVIRVKSELGNKPANWNPSGEHYKITLFVAGRVLSFDFWDSRHNMINNIPCDERGAVACFASDAMTGINSNSPDDIVSEFGYDKPTEAVRVYRGVKKAQRQAERAGLSWDELAELADY